ncbi:MAG: amino acid ABC transporter substrate-binding protein, partial [Oscillochloris sp.]|nr:amino acid ABC transporter substrate-binding protein [Oscillochloris sp.]
WRHLRLPATAVANAPAPTAPPVDTPAAAQVAPAAGVLQRVQERGRLICGTNADLPGFGFYDQVRDRWSGFDVDFCRAVAAAVLGDADAIEFVGLTTAGRNERFAAVRDGQVDVLFRNTTWTLGRDLADLAFGPTTFHDGQTFMVRADAGIATVDDMDGARICVAQGTTSEQNLNDDFAARGIDFAAILFDDESPLYAAYDDGECDAVTSDSSQLVSKRQTLDDPEAHIILGDRISREPLGPAFIEGDEQWRDIITWAVFATMYAEELRVTQANAAQLASSSEDPRVRRLLGVEGDFGAQLGISAEFAYQILTQVGSYADIYERNLGENTPFALERGPNKAWNLGAGGVLASPPFR